ncbi:MAG TPA: DUF302 domain-containing protein [Gammaproteobacteria bacterium]|nr:DUF302 domain-containing protein [Gammaproteobacteria bacterium]
MKRLRHFLMILVLLVIGFPAQAIITGELIMLRSAKQYDVAMENLQSAIKKQGYTITGIRQVDEGLAKSGYKSDKYRIVFFEKAGEVANLKKNYPEISPYLPLKIVIFAEANETLLVTSDPAVYIDLFPDPRLQELFRRWHQEVTGIMQNVRDSK